MTGDPWGDDSRRDDPTADDPVEPGPAGDEPASEPLGDDAAGLSSVGGGDHESRPGELGLTETGSVAGLDGGSGAVEDDPVARIAGASSRIRAAARRAIEALVLVTEEPISVHLLGQLLEMSPAIVDDMCRELAAEYEDQGRGFHLVEVAGGWRYQSHPDLSPYVERFVLEGQTAKLSAAALETLAIVAYKQPISRAQVAAIRGVSVDGVMRTLQQRGYIAEIGKDPGPGQAVLFGTTRMFVEKLGLNDLNELPPLGDFVPGADVVEQLERGLRPDREPLRPEDAMGPNDGMPPGDSMTPDDDLGPNDPFGPENAMGPGNGLGIGDDAFGPEDAMTPGDDLGPNDPFGPEDVLRPGNATGATGRESVWGLTGRSADGGEDGVELGRDAGGESGVEEE